MPGNIILSLLMPTTPQREVMFTALYNEVMAQKSAMNTIHPEMADIEILVDARPRFLDGGPSIGKKRESLVRQATGKYLCFLDSDESISPNYVESLVRLCLQGNDVCTFRALAKMQHYIALVDMRLIYKVNDQLSPDYTCRRPPWHINPVKSEYAKRVKFSDKNNAEDFEWMEKVLAHCTTESHTDKILFTYQHGSHSEADQIPLP